MRLYYYTHDSVDVEKFKVRRREFLVPNPEPSPAFIGKEIRRYVTADIPQIGERFIDPETKEIGGRYDLINDPLSLDAIDVSWEEAMAILAEPEWEDI